MINYTYNGDSALIFDDKGGLYYYKESSECDRLYYYNEGEKPVRVDLPIGISIIYKGVIYGYSSKEDDSFFIARYENGEVVKLMDLPDLWYFSKEGLYYQIDNEIYLMNYDSNNLKLIVKIPEELYSNWLGSKKFVVYRGLIWYYNSELEVFWSYDIESGVFTKFNEGGLSAINNGYLYFWKYDELSKESTLWRLNTETYYVEKVSEFDAHTIAFYKDNILLQSVCEIRKVNLQGETKILEDSQVGDAEYFGFGDIATYKDRIIIQFGEEIIEIDIDGNIVNRIA